VIDRLSETIAQLREAQKKLTCLPVARIVEQLDEWASRWQDPHSPWRKEASEKSAFPFETVAPGLEVLLSGLRQGPLWALLEEELGDPLALDGFRPRRIGGWRRAVSYPLVGCVLAGNTPLASWPPLLASLLVKSACFAKMSSDETLWTSILIRTLQEAMPEMGACLAAEVWPGGAREIEEFLIQHTDLMMVFGSDPTIFAWRGRMPLHKPFLGYGHRASFAVILRECLTPEVAEKLAWDTTLYDQQGCLSPQVAYVERGGRVAPEEFAEWVAGGLARFARRYPAARDFASVATIRQMRDMAAFAEGAHLWGADDLSWTLCLYPPGPFPFSCAHRFLFLVPIQRLQEIPDLVAGSEPFLGAVGLAAPLERQEEAAETLAPLGISRICPPGTMQQPPLGWHHEGLPPLGRLVRWVDKEV